MFDSNNIRYFYIYAITPQKYTCDFFRAKRKEGVYASVACVENIQYIKTLSKLEISKIK